jgi:putative intracellular protease/amidase
MAVLVRGNIPKARGLSLMKIEVGTQTLANGGTFTTELNHPQAVFVEAKVADHVAAVEDITNNVVTITLLDVSTPGTPVFQTSAKTIQYIAIGY